MARLLAPTGTVKYADLSVRDIVVTDNDSAEYYEVVKKMKTVVHLQPCSRARSLWTKDTLLIYDKQHAEKFLRFVERDADNIVVYCVPIDWYTRGMLKLRRNPKMVGKRSWNKTFFRTKKEADVRLKQLVDARTASLLKQLSKLQSFSFVATVEER